MASYPMNVGFFSCCMSILQGIGGFGSDIFSTSFILSFFMVCGVSPDCLMMVKNACSRGSHCSVILLILLISSFSVSLFFIFLIPPKLVSFLYVIVSKS